MYFSFAIPCYFLCYFLCDVFAGGTGEQKGELHYDGLTLWVLLGKIDGRDQEGENIMKKPTARSLRAAAKLLPGRMQQDIVYKFNIYTPPSREL